MDRIYIGFFASPQKESQKRMGVVALFSKLVIKKLIKQILVVPTLIYSSI